jgi:bifunctional non-homologous end joining protein LigD
MQVEDHPVSYFDFEGTIPEGNYGGGTVMVWDVGTWQPLSPVPVDGEYVPGTEKEAAEMLAKGDLKLRLNGKRLKGDFALIRMKGRRPGSKGNEWLLIKKKDEHVVPGFDIDSYKTSVLTGRTMSEIAGDKGSAEWTSSRPAGRGKLKAAWLADAVARADKKRQGLTTGDTEVTEKNKKGKSAGGRRAVAAANTAPALQKKTRKSPVSSVSSVVKSLAGAIEKPMPAKVRPMLATPIEEPFDNPAWLFEIKWDGYRAVAFIKNGAVRLVSRNQNDLTGQFPELRGLPGFIKAKQAVVDGEIVALDEQGRPSFSLMQQRTGFQAGRRRLPGREGVPILYYAFDLIYLDGYDLHKVGLEQRKELLRSVLQDGEAVRFSDHYPEKGRDLFEVARQRGLEGILAKKRDSAYQEDRTRDWLKIKITQRQECVIGGYTDPEGSRQYFGSLVLGLYDNHGHLIHVGQVGTGFDHGTLKQIYEQLRPLETKTNPFHGEIGGLRKVHFVRPELVAEIKFSEWTHEMKMRAPVFLGLRFDKDPKECRLEEAVPSTEHPPDKRKN